MHHFALYTALISPSKSAGLQGWKGGKRGIHGSKVSLDVMKVQMLDAANRVKRSKTVGLPCVVSRGVGVSYERVTLVRLKPTCRVSLGIRA